VSLPEAIKNFKKTFCFFKTLRFSFKIHKSCAERFLSLFGTALREKKCSVEVGRTFQLDRKCCKMPNKNFFSTVYQRERGTIGRNNQKTNKKWCKIIVY
jgi:hypothetical protein